MGDLCKYGHNYQDSVTGAYNWWGLHPKYDKRTDRCSGNSLNLSPRDDLDMIGADLFVETFFFLGWSLVRTSRLVDVFCSHCL